MMTKEEPGVSSLMEEDSPTAAITAGRLKFFKEGRCLLELTHRNGRNWCPTTKKVYWPPSFPPSSSPPCELLKRDSSVLLRGGTQSPSSYVKVKALRKSSAPKRLADEESQERSFVMAPPASMFSLRRKVRSIKRKRRSPFAPIRVGAFLLRVEAAGAQATAFPKRPTLSIDRIRKSSRLERLISKLPLPRISIKSWAPPTIKNTTLKNTIKSELFSISSAETQCSLAAKTPLKGPVKVKAATQNIAADTPPRPSKTLPVTPTLARIKSEPLHSSGSLLLTPDMKRVKVEISGPSSPDRFTSPPRKRPSDAPLIESPSQTHKRHRLSTDSLGSSREGSNSPFPLMSCQSSSSSNSNNVPASPPPHHIHHRPPNGRMSSFSIDSLIHRDEAKLVRPHPASPSRLNDLRYTAPGGCDTDSHGSRTPTPASSSFAGGSPAPNRRPLSPPPTSAPPPLVSITPYASRNMDTSRSMDPRLAHLAGLAADPRLGLTPTGGPYSLVNPYSYLLPLMQAGGVTAPGRLNWPPISSASVNASHRSSTSTAVAWPGQYRGEPKIASVEVGRQSPEAPLNLSLK